MTPHTLDVLEFHRIVEEVTEYCATIPGVNDLLGQGVRTRTEELESLHGLVKEWSALEEDSDPFSGAIMVDPGEMLERLSRQGTVLEGTELAALRQILSTATRVVRAVKAFEGADRLMELVVEAPDVSSIGTSIAAVIDNDGEVKESAVPALRRLRHTLSRSRRTLQKDAQRLLQDPGHRQYWTSDQPVVRDGRVVLPLAANYQGQIKGIVHEQSGTGQTVYIEPFEMVETNNAVRTTLDKIAAEVQRVLREMSDSVRNRLPDIDSALRIMGHIDSIHARAAYGRIHAARFPKIGNVIDLKQARHPLLGPTAVPIDLHLTAEERVLIITGPNTGGKTVAIKTAGVLALMNQYGIPLPLEDKSVLPVFTGIYADIGDEQSISQSLSTFSGHMSTIASILSTCDDRSLVLLDELGAGTDPEEGSALAMAILDTLRERGSTVLVSSHHTALKHYAYREEDCTNASVEFDDERLVPTYRLRMGIPGESHAIRVARHTGIPPAVTESASAYVREGQTEGTRLINALTAQKAAVEELQRELIREQDAMERKNKELSAAAERLSAKEQDVLNRERRALQGFLSEARQKIERTVKEVTDSRERSHLKEARDVVDEVAGEIHRREKRLKEERQSRASTHRFAPGQSVRLRSSGVRGIIKERSGDSAWHVQTNSFRIIAQERDLLPDQESHPEEGRRSIEVEAPRRMVPFQIDVRGRRLEDALEVVREQLDAALVGGMSHFSIVHGKGNGILQQGIRRYLAEHGDSLRFEYATPDQGGFGKTVVYLK